MPAGPHKDSPPDPQDNQDTLQKVLQRMMQMQVPKPMATQYNIAQLQNYQNPLQMQRQGVTSNQVNVYAQAVGKTVTFTRYGNPVAPDPPQLASNGDTPKRNRLPVHQREALQMPDIPDTRLLDLKDGDQVIVMPTATGATSLYDDRIDYPYWGGLFGELVGQVDLSDGRVRIQFRDADGNQGHITSNRTTGRLSTYGLVLYAKAVELGWVDGTVAGKVDFDSVVLAAHKKQQIMDAIKQVDHHDLIFKTWGFAKVFEKGTAISMLFYGPPGTGKTLMAQAIADHFGYKLTVISTAEIESSEPGQAERNIKMYFEQAGDKTVLLFDECDSLIHDRSSVGMILGAQINALLTGLEHYKGIALFTTNRLGRLDEAFNRRLSLKLEFDMPSAEERIKIWQRMFPKAAPLDEGIDWQTLGAIRITGGYIKNAVLRAARMAANSEAQRITQDILFEAVTREVTSLVQFEDAVRSTPKPARPLGPGLTRQAGLNKVADVDKVEGAS